MSAQQRNMDQKFEALQLHSMGYKKSHIHSRLKDRYVYPVSSRMLSYWIKEFKELVGRPDNPDVPFEWHRMGEYDLPWEAGEYLTDMWFHIQEYPLLTTNALQKPTARDVEWWWRVHLAASDFNYDDVFLMAQHYSARELISLLTDVPASYSDLDGYLTYKPWRDEDRANSYRKAIMAGDFPDMGRDTQGLQALPDDSPHISVLTWSQKSDTGTLLTPSQLVGLMALNLTGEAQNSDSEEIESASKRTISVSIDKALSLFTTEQISHLPIRAQETLKQLKWWKFQNEGESNVT